jgi:predicted nucleic acid-binding protein
MFGLSQWLLRPGAPIRYHQGYVVLLQQAKVIALDEPIAFRAARIGSRLRRQSPRLGTIDLFVAATALEHHFTLVTHDISHYAQIPGLASADWTVP